jgi:hypothetical protein
MTGTAPTNTPLETGITGHLDTPATIFGSEVLVELKGEYTYSYTSYSSLAEVEVRLSSWGDSSCRQYGRGDDQSAFHATVMPGSNQVGNFSGIPNPVALLQARKNEARLPAARSISVDLELHVPGEPGYQSVTLGCFPVSP